MTLPARDTLFLLKPGFVDADKAWFCPYCAQVAGMLAYFPQLRETLDIVEVDFPRPRRAIVELVGEAQQSCPVLVLADASELPPELNEDLLLVQGRRVIGRTKAILHYLAASRGLPLPH